MLMDIQSTGGINTIYNKYIHRYIVNTIQHIRISCAIVFRLYFEPASGTIREKAAQLCINYTFISGIYAQYVFRYVCNMGFPAD